MKDKLKDPIIETVRAARRKLAEDNDFSLQKLLDYLKKEESISDKKAVNPHQAKRR